MPRQLRSGLFPKADFLSEVLFQDAGQEDGRDIMAGDNIRHVAAIGTGTVGASWIAVFLARGLTVAASVRRPEQRHFCVDLSPRLGRVSPDCLHCRPSRPGRR